MSTDGSTARSTTTSREQTALILEGDVTHRFTIMGFKSVMKLYTAGTYDEILQRSAGHDEASRNYRRNMWSVVFALRSVGDDNFDGNSLEAKERFVKGISVELFNIFLGELLIAQTTSGVALQKRNEDLKKASPDQS